MRKFSHEYGEKMQEFLEQLLQFKSLSESELQVQNWFIEQLDSMGFETYKWTADATELSEHSAFPNNPDEIAVTDRPSVGGVMEFGDPDAGPTLILNGHVDVVPADEASWTSAPFEPTWDGDDLAARGAVDMKSGLAACVFAARYLDDTAEDIDGRVVVESVAGEEDLGLGATAAVLSNPYPFERDAAIIAEPTDLKPILAADGALMKRLRLTGRSAHAGQRWKGESVLPHFEEIRRAFEDLEVERSADVSHPLYEDFPIPCPVNIGTVRAGSWAASVPATLEAELRISVTPGETIADVEAQFQQRLDEVVSDNEWLSSHPPEFERYSVQFEPAEIGTDEPVVSALEEAMVEHEISDTEPEGLIAGADSRQYIHAGIPTVLFGPGNIEQAHFPNETVHWPDVLTAGSVIAAGARQFLG